MTSSPALELVDIKLSLSFVIVGTVTVSLALPKNTQYISSVPFVSADANVSVVPDAVYALPLPGS